LLVLAAGCRSSPPDPAGVPAHPSSAAAGGAESEGEGAEGDEPDETPSAAPSSGAGPRTLASEARRELALVRATTYTHRTHIDEASGVFELDCSGFVDNALARVAPGALEALKGFADPGKRPQAKTFVALLSAMAPGARRGPWQRLALPSELVPGDVIAWLATEHKKDFTGHYNTGHVMIVDAAARRGADDEWIVPVIDSSAGHGGDDPRRAPDVTGLGRGEIVLVVEGGAVVGFRRSVLARSKRNESKVVLGRLP
jgi:hypothetical protein